MASFASLRAAARRRLPRLLFDYVDGGAGDESVIRMNRAAFERVRLRPRTGTWNPTPDLRTTVLGTELSMPVLTAPCGGMRLVHAAGDVAVARAAVTARIAPIVASGAGYSLEDVGRGIRDKWLQLYKFSNTACMRELVGRAEAARYRVLVLTIDTNIAGKREREMRDGFSYDLRLTPRNAVRLGPQMAARPRWLAGYLRDGMPRTIPNTVGYGIDGRALSLTDMARSGAESFSPTWDDFPWIRRHWSGPVVVKGILTAADAIRAADLGADGVIVSNHGGRQLDSVPPTLDALPEVVAAVGGSIDVLMDSGIRTGSDVIKALARGAKAVLLGRPVVWGLAIDGERGVAGVLESVRDDLVRTMCLLGCRRVADLDSTWQW